MVASAAKLRERRWVEKLQIQSSKSKAPNPKLQIPKNLQDSNPNTAQFREGRLGSFGRWDLGFLWSLVFGGWSLCKSALLPVSPFAKTPVMDFSKDRKADIHSEEFLRSLMRKQLRLSVTCAATFLVALLGLPLLNYFFPELMATRVFGFTLTWFLLGVLFVPLLWLISWIFIRRSIALEEAEVAEVEDAEA